MKTHLGNAWTQCASWDCSCPSWLGGRSRNSKIHPQMSGGTDRDLVVLWFGLNCESWNLFYDDGKIGTSLFLKSHSYDGNFFFGWVRYLWFCKALLESSTSEHSGHSYFVGENIGEMLCFNVLLEVPFLIHCLLADPTIERSIFSC